MFLNTRIKSHQHILNEEAFKLFSSNEHSFRVSEVQSDSFTLSIESLKNEDEEKFLARAHSIIEYYLVAINIATLGHFSWDFYMVSPVPYFKSEKSGVFENFIFLHKKSGYKADEELLEINTDLVWRSLKVMLALGNERDDGLQISIRRLNIFARL